MDGGQVDLQANRAQDAQGRHVALGLDAFRRAWLDFKLALAGLHAAEENEAQVAHWVIEGMASFADLREVREQVKAARVVRSVARKRYIRLSTLAGWTAVETRVALTYAATLVVGLAAQQAGRPDLISAPTRVLAHTWEGVSCE